MHDYDFALWRPIMDAEDCKKFLKIEETAWRNFKKRVGLLPIPEVPGNKYRGSDLLRICGLTKNDLQITPETINLYEEVKRLEKKLAWYEAWELKVKAVVNHGYLNGGTSHGI